MGPTDSSATTTIVTEIVTKKKMCVKRTNTIVQAHFSFERSGARHIYVM
jgi:hypothetical protein